MFSALKKLVGSDQTPVRDKNIPAGLQSMNQALQRRFAKGVQYNSESEPGAGPGGRSQRWAGGQPRRAGPSGAPQPARGPRWRGKASASVAACAHIQVGSSVLELAGAWEACGVGTADLSVRGSGSRSAAASPGTAAGVPLPVAQEGAPCKSLGVS